MAGTSLRDAPVTKNRQDSRAPAGSAPSRSACFADRHRRSEAPRVEAIRVSPRTRPEISRRNYVVLAGENLQLAAKCFRRYQSAVKIGVKRLVTLGQDSVIRHNRGSRVTPAAQIAQLRQTWKNACFKNGLTESHAGATALTFTRHLVQIQKLRKVFVPIRPLRHNLLIARTDRGTLRGVQAGDSQHIAGESYPPNPTAASQPFSPALTHSRFDGMSLARTGKSCRHGLQ